MKTKITRIEYVAPSMLKEHDRSNLIPKMTDDEWESFIESVRNRCEIIKPLEILSDGRVIDGRHRLKAALECEIEMVPVIYKDMSESEVIEHMKDSGLRRNLTHGQRAAIVLRCEELVNELKEQAKENSIINLRQGSNIPDVVPVPHRETGKKTRDVLAEQARVGGKSMQSLMSVQKKAPDLFEQVASGLLPIKTAYKEMIKREQPPENVLNANNKKEETNVIQMPKQQSPKKSRLSEIKKEAEQKISISQIDGESSLSENNILRHRADTDFRNYATRLVIDYELLKTANSESINIYLNSLKKVVEGATILIAEFEESDNVKNIYDQISTLIRYDRSEEGQSILNKTNGGIKNER